MEEIKAVVQENAEECKKHLSLFDDYKLVVFELLNIFFIQSFTD